MAFGNKFLTSLQQYLRALISGSGKQGNRSLASRAQFTPPSITLKEHGALKELVDDSLTFLDSSGVEWVAPKGTLTDGATVPRLLLPITSDRYSKEFLKAAVVHDAYCQQENETRTPNQYHKKPWEAVHRMFYEAMIVGGTNEVKAKIMFAAVWLAGPRWDDPERELQEVSGDVLTRGFIGSRKWIEQDSPTLEQIEADLDRRESLLHDLYVFEQGILNALQNDDRNQAGVLLRDENTLLARALQMFPEDLMLLNFKGYWHKNRAILYRMSNNDNKVSDELSESERAFEAVIKSEPEDPSALNGLGSVSILRNDLDRAEQYVKKALAIAPNYEAATHDLQLIRKLRGR